MCDEIPESARETMRVVNETLDAPTLPANCRRTRPEGVCSTRFSTGCWTSDCGRRQHTCFGLPL